MSQGSVIELDYRGKKILVYEMRVAAVPDRGTMILGETLEQAKTRLKELEAETVKDAPANPISEIELQLRLILSTPDQGRRLELLGDWLKIWARNQAEREKDLEPRHWLTPPP
jgi:hypothetical protein